ncbi:hypothetical protein, partial [Vibrio parahaemolyticus]|uniref:hypothetical protein n=1 Tax=Vibrio parahaemolyticus TaxID=670 RepID=UPI001C608C12
ERLKNNTPNSETLSITQQKITIITATTTYNLMTVLMEIVSKKNIEHRRRRSLDRLCNASIIETDL